MKNNLDILNYSIIIACAENKHKKPNLKDRFIRKTKTFELSDIRIKRLELISSATRTIDYMSVTTSSLALQKLLYLHRASPENRATGRSSRDAPVAPRVPGAMRQARD